MANEGWVILPSKVLDDDIRFFTETLGMKMDTIYPADHPRVAEFSGMGLRLRIDMDEEISPGLLRICTDEKERGFAGHTQMVAPNGTVVEIVPINPPMVIPKTEHSFQTRRLADSDSWVIGRAGMYYRDLIQGRLGGSIIASHIRIAEGGPVPDMVHYHKVGFQLIFCINGWVDVVYEDQGEPIRLTAGDCFIQPPEIRHRVLLSGDNLEVVEIGVPADHVTVIDHEMELPTKDLRPDREWQGQKFVHNQASEATWQKFRLPGFVCRDTTICENTKGVASVQVVKPSDGKTVWSSHEGDILFNYIMSGGLTLEGEGVESQILGKGDAFVIPPGMRVKYSDAMQDLELIEVSVPGEFKTQFD
jgi:quercetin dioxygenase-like cupin family protein